MKTKTWEKHAQQASTDIYYALCAVGEPGVLEHLRDGVTNLGRAIEAYQTAATRERARRLTARKRRAK